MPTVLPPVSAGALTGCGAGGRRGPSTPTSAPTDSWKADTRTFKVPTWTATVRHAFLSGRTATASSADPARTMDALSPPELSPLEQEVLDEYERLAENMKTVSKVPSRRRARTRTQREADPRRRSWPAPSTPWRRSRPPKSWTGCATSSARRAWSSPCSRRACTASCCSRRSVGTNKAANAERLRAPGRRFPPAWRGATARHSVDALLFGPPGRHHRNAHRHCRSLATRTAPHPLGLAACRPVGYSIPGQPQGTQDIDTTPRLWHIPLRFQSAAWLDARLHRADFGHRWSR